MMHITATKPNPIKRSPRLCCANSRLTALLLATFLSVLIPGSFASESPAAPSAQELLERADRIRFPADAFQVDVSITTTEPDRESEVREYRILSKGNDRTLVQTTAPPVDRGQILLMRDRDLWAFLPNLSQPIRLPLAQKLTGQVANGDLARANFVGDYTPTILRTESVDGKLHYVLQLDATDRWVTYHRVLYWVGAEDNRPLKADFFALSGRLLKHCHYEGFDELGGVVRPTRLVMEDALRPGRTSVMLYSNMRARELADKLFNKDYLKKLSR
jgi:outer membrane lipoprotein-sorting protein